MALVRMIVWAMVGAMIWAMVVMDEGAKHPEVMSWIQKL